MNKGKDTMDLTDDILIPLGLLAALVIFCYIGWHC
jgi:hypothetical protein